MAVAFVRSHVGEFVKSAGTTDVYALTSLVPAGNLLVMALVHDNFSSASTPTVSSITKAAGETASWVYLGRAVYGSAGTAGAFSGGELWAIKTTVAWANATSLTVTYSNSITMKSQCIFEFSGAEATLRSTVGMAYSAGTATSSATTTGTTPVIGDLAVGLLFQSNSTSSPANDTDTTGGSWVIPASATVGSSGASAATNNIGMLSYKILTTASHQTHNSSAATLTAGNGVIVAILRATPDPAITQAAYRWYDEGTESGSTPYAAQDTAVTGNIANGDATGTLRIRLQETGVGPVPTTDDWQLQWQKSIALLDSWPDTQWDGGANFLNPGVVVAQSFMGNGLPLIRMGAYLDKAGSPTGTIQAVLYAHTGTFGSGTGTGTVLATSTTTKSHTDIGSSPAWVRFDFDGSYTLTNGTPYVIGLIFTGTAPDGGTMIRWQNDASPGHAGSLSTRATGGTWTYNQFADLIFEVYTTGAWANVTASSTAAATYDSPNLTNGGATTNRLTGGTGTFVAGKVSEDSLMDDLGWGVGNHTELVYALKIKAADVVDGDTLRFRVLRNGATATVTYTQTPTISIVNIPVAVTQAAYGFFADGTEPGSAALASTNTAITADVSAADLPLQVRVRLQSTSVIQVPVTDDWQLQWEANASGTWANVAVPPNVMTYDSTNVDSYSALAGTGPDETSRLGQSFMGDGKVIRRVGFWLKRTGTGLGSLSASVYAHTGTFGSTSKATGTVLQISTNIVATSDLSTTPEWVYFDFDGSLTLSNGTPYVVVIANSGGSATQPAQPGVDASSPTAPGNLSYYTNAAWGTSSSQDLVYKIYTGASVSGGVALSDSFEDAATTSFSVVGRTNIAFGQTFLGDGKALSRAGFHMARIGTVSGPVTATLYAHTGTYGSGSAVDGALAVSTTSVDAADMSVDPTYTWYEFDFDGTYTLEAGTPYVIAATADFGGTDNLNAVRVHRVTINTPHPGNASIRPRSGAWSVAAYDMEFRVYTAGSSASTVVGYDSPSLADGQEFATPRLTGGTGTFFSGKVSETGLVEDLGFAGNNYTEVLYSITLVAADVANSDVIRLRVVRNGAPLDSYTQTPTITASKVAGPVTHTATGSLAVTTSVAAAASRTTLPTTTALAVTTSRSAAATRTTLATTTALAVTTTATAAATAVTPKPKTTTISTDFTSAAWSTSGFVGFFAKTSTSVTIESPGTMPYAYTTTGYDLTGSNVYVRIGTPAGAGAGSIVSLHAANSDLNYVAIYVVDSTMYVTVVENGTTVYTSTGVAYTPCYVRFQKGAGPLAFTWGPDGTTWNTWVSYTPTFPLTDMTMRVGSTPAAMNPNIFEKVNTPTAGTVYTTTAVPLAVTTTVAAAATRTTLAPTTALAVTTSRSAAATRTTTSPTTALAVTTSRTAAATRTTFSATTALAVTTSRTAAATRATFAAATALPVTTTTTAASTRATTMTTTALAVTTSRTAATTRSTFVTGSLALTVTTTAAATAASFVAVTGALGLTATITSTAVPTKTTTGTALAVTTSSTAAATRATMTTITALAVTTSRSASVTRATFATPTALSVTTNRTATVVKATTALTTALPVTTTATAAAITGAGVVAALPVTNTLTSTVVATRTTASTALAVTTSRTAAVTKTTFATPTALAVTVTLSSTVAKTTFAAPTALAVTTSLSAAISRATFATTTALSVTTVASAAAQRVAAPAGAALAVTTARTATAVRTAAPATAALAVTVTLTATAVRSAAPATAALAVTTSSTAAAVRTGFVSAVALAITTSRTAAATRTTLTASTALPVITSRTASVVKATSVGTTALAVTTSVFASPTPGGAVSAVALAVTATLTAAATRTTFATAALAVTTSRSAAAARVTFTTATALAVTTSRTAVISRVTFTTSTALAVTTSRSAAISRVTSVSTTALLITTVISAATTPGAAIPTVALTITTTRTAAAGRTTYATAVTLTVTTTRTAAAGRATTSTTTALVVTTTFTATAGRVVMVPTVALTVLTSRTAELTVSTPSGATKGSVVVGGVEKTVIGHWVVIGGAKKPVVASSVVLGGVKHAVK